MTAVVGIDLGIHKIALSIWHDGQLTATRALDSSASHRAEQLCEIGEYAYLTVMDVLDSDKADVYVIVEEPLIGNNRKYSLNLAMSYGAVLCCLGDVESVSGLYGVNVSTWKKQVCGDGRADKEKIRNTLKKVNGSYSELCDGDQDRYDAACIGLYGVLLHARTEGLELSVE